MSGNGWLTNRRHSMPILTQSIGVIEPTFLEDVVATLCLFGKVGDERLQFGALCGGRN
jgi:hypothetical protein